MNFVPPRDLYSWPASSIYTKLSKQFIPYTRKTPELVTNFINKTTTINTLQGPWGWKWLCRSTCPQGLCGWWPVPHAGAASLSLSLSLMNKPPASLLVMLITVYCHGVLCPYLEFKLWGQNCAHGHVFIEKTSGSACVCPALKTKSSKRKLNHQQKVNKYLLVFGKHNFSTLLILDPHTKKDSERVLGEKRHKMERETTVWRGKCDESQGLSHEEHTRMTGTPGNLKGG